MVVEMCKGGPYYYFLFTNAVGNVWCIKNRTKHSSKTLLRLVQFLKHQTLYQIGKIEASLKKDGGRAGRKVWGWI